MGNEAGRWGGLAQYGRWVQGTALRRIGVLLCTMLVPLVGFVSPFTIRRRGGRCWRRVGNEGGVAMVAAKMGWAGPVRPALSPVSRTNRFRIAAALPVCIPHSRF